jgi:hypothetical protein
MLKLAQDLALAHEACKSIGLPIDQLAVELLDCHKLPIDHVATAIDLGLSSGSDQLVDRVA